MFPENHKKSVWNFITDSNNMIQTEQTSDRVFIKNKTFLYISIKIIISQNSAQILEITEKTAHFLKIARFNQDKSHPPDSGLQKASQSKI